ncbi:chloroplastic group IIA intron splicing facilitator CRS1, chloroplastic [Silene latifolia]|uniref:chloroplastic group IIA intron splicing facilitator CRS1, chloroplastic n=1 Tax=Silene latifolia TaxID=37657 RepID=UPI003D7858B9
MNAIMFVSHPQLPFQSLPFTINNLKPLNSLSPNATSYFLQNPSFSSSNNNNNGDEDKISQENSEATIPDKTKIRMPTAPWMKGPLLVDSHEVINLAKPKFKKKLPNSDQNKSDKSLTEKVSGRMGKKAVKKLVRSIEQLQLDNHLVTTHKNWDDTQKNWGDLGGGFLRGDDEENEMGRKKRMPWERNEGKMVFRRVKKEKVVTAAELSLDKELLERLRGEACKMRKWVKVKKLGVTERVVDEVHSIWANNELVMLQFDLPLCRNMDRAREIVEIKTGGLVVWSRKDSLVAYRGCDYFLRRRFRKTNLRSTREEAYNSIANQQNEDDHPVSPGLIMDRNFSNYRIDRSLYEREGDRLLDGLGPRFIDWWYPKPLPVDGDLLPEVVPGFKPPFRLCPPKVRPQLRDDELTYLRTLAQQLPVHFVLGRNSKLQGLAVSILKLWERSVIAKIAIKWGVQNTSNELMASELKRLTGGILLLRNKFIIILYRGKDFLTGNEANMILESEMELQQWQLHEEDARLKTVGILDSTDKNSADTSIIGTLAEYEHNQTICYNAQCTSSEAEVKREAEKEKLKKQLKTQEHKLGILKLKINKAEQELLKLNFAWKPSEPEPDQELLTEEERVCFRKMGLKMDNFLVLGRRGVFDGVIEGLHQHWKHRELVKVITMQRKSLQVVYTARFLERESGGILVSIDKLKVGHSITIYRGKNYKRPLQFGDNLLDKKKALKSSLERQRRGSLKFFAYQREKEIADLRLKLGELEGGK